MRETRAAQFQFSVVRLTRPTAWPRPRGARVSVATAGSCNNNGARTRRRRRAAAAGARDAGRWRPVGCRDPPGRLPAHRPPPGRSTPGARSAGRRVCRPSGPSSAAHLKQSHAVTDGPIRCSGHLDLPISLFPSLLSRFSRTLTPVNLNNSLQPITTLPKARLFTPGDALVSLFLNSCTRLSFGFISFLYWT